MTQIHTAKLAVRSLYDAQKIRIEMGNRLAGQIRHAFLGPSPRSETTKEMRSDFLRRSKALYAQIEEEMGGVTVSHLVAFFALHADEAPNSGIISAEWAERLLARLKSMTDIEASLLRDVRDATADSDISPWLKSVKGCGPAMSGAIISEIGDPARFENVSKLWAYCGLHVIGNRAARRKRGERANWSAFLKTKLIGVLGPSFLKCGSPYREHYDRYKHRLESERCSLSPAEHRRATEAITSNDNQEDLASHMDADAQSHGASHFANDDQENVASQKGFDAQGCNASKAPSEPQDAHASHPRNEAHSLIASQKEGEHHGTFASHPGRETQKRNAGHECDESHVSVAGQVPGESHAISAGHTAIEAHAPLASHQFTESHRDDASQPPREAQAVAASPAELESQAEHASQVADDDQATIASHGADETHETLASQTMNDDQRNTASQSVNDDHLALASHNLLPNGCTKAHMHNKAVRFMVKQFLSDLLIEWRTLRGLPNRLPYAEEYLGKRA